jgi:HlyD family secretion protein
MEISARRSIVWLVSALVGSALMTWSLWPSPEPVEIAQATTGPITVTLDEEGETRVRERFAISAPVAGRLLRIELEPGDPVVAGETVLAIFQPRDPRLLDPRSRAEAEAEVKALEAELEQARHERASRSAELDYAKRECDRARALGDQGILSEDRLDAARLEENRAVEALSAAEHAVASANHRLASARARLLNLGEPNRRGDAPISIRAPIDGVVLRRSRESESVVEAGEPLIEVGDPDDLEIVADYLSRDAVRIRPGARVLIDRWGGDGLLEARVRRVEPSGFTKISALGVEEKRVNVVIDLVTPAAERPGLADGFRVETRIVVLQCEDVVQVPTGSLFRRGEDWAVFAVEEGRAALVSVEIGARTPASVEVRAGLESGDQIIVHPADAISDGVRVTPRTSPY